LSPTAVSNSAAYDGLVRSEDIYPDLTNSSVAEIVKKIEDEATEWREYEKQLRVWQRIQYELRNKNHEDIDPDLLIYSHVAGLMNEAPKSKYGHRPVLHLVADDCQSSALFNASTKNVLLNLAIRHRHVGDGLGVTMWFLIQNYSTNSGIPRAIRENATVLCLFGIKDTRTLEKVAREMGGEVDPEQFLEAYSHATAERHSFLVVDFSARSPEYRFRKRWDELIHVE
jgi:hypothetical protein